MKSITVAAVVAALLAVGAASYWAGGRAAAPPKAPSGAAQARSQSGGPAAVLVEATTVAIEKLPRAISTVGSLRSDETVVIRPEIAGRVAAISFREGEAVAAGAVLVRLDDSVQSADVARAEANLVLSRSKFDRAAELREKAFISGQAKDEAENNLRVAQAEVELARARLAKTEIRAPFGGVIGLRQVSAGDYVKEGQDLVNLEKTDTLKVDFRVPEIHFAEVRAGQSMQVTLDALPDRTFEGRVYALNPLLDAAGRALVIRARIPNALGQLRPGMFARVRLLTNEVAESLVIPEESVFPVGEEKFVFRIVDGRAQRRKVEIGQRVSGRVEIVSGLEASDRIVTAGHIKLREGSAVRVAGDPAPASVGKAAPPAGAKGSS